MTPVIFSQSSCVKSFLEPADLPNWSSSQNMIVTPVGKFYLRLKNIKTVKTSWIAESWPQKATELDVI